MPQKFCEILHANLYMLVLFGVVGQNLVRGEKIFLLGTEGSPNIDASVYSDYTAVVTVQKLVVTIIINRQCVSSSPRLLSITSDTAALRRE